MKQKYTVTVADMELNIVSDASPDEVENIVGILDRRMRDINLHSPRCTKNEAAILCALSYCSERIAMQEAFKKVEKDAFRFAGENEKLKKTVESLQEEIDRLRKDAAVMQSILDRAAAVGMKEEAKNEAPARVKYVPKQFPDKQTAEGSDEPERAGAPEAPVAAAEAPAVPAPAAAVPAVAQEKDDGVFVLDASRKDKRTGKKSSVGAMFDMLTYEDV